MQAEILPQIRQKISVDTQKGFVVLVAEDAHNPEGIVGVVEVGIQSGRVRSFACITVPTFESRAVESVSEYKALALTHRQDAKSPETCQTSQKDQVGSLFVG